MLIGIDVSRVTKEEKTGIENYSKELILNLAKIDRENHYILYVKPEFDPILKILPKNFRLKLINRQKFWTEIGLSLEMLKNPPDALLVPAYGLPKFTPKNSTIVIHDLAFKYFPEVYSKKQIRIQNKVISRAIKKKAKIIVYSKSTADDLKKFYKIDEKLIHFVPMGFSIRERPSDKKLPENIEKPYVLFVGRIEVKKNLINLISAYKLLRKERKIKHKLVLVGKPGFGYDEIKEAIKNPDEIKNDIIETGFVSDEVLSALYQNASVFVFPSLHEGFGIPILEAFNAEIPVVTSNTSSMPEVAGNAAILVNPKKPFEIAAAISQILNKPDLAKKLVLAGKKRLLDYDWEKTAKNLLKILTLTRPH